ncbi:MAG: MBL fold metallo-hydrolase [Desulfobacterales bacterium]|nr:MBL fold metallo-hydrolase [Desulfobacterales bacterium]
MKQITEGVYFIQGQDEMIPDCHVYVLGKPSSGDLTLVDAGLMGKSEYKIQSIIGLGIDLSHIKRVIMTHSHLDHMGCLPEILKKLPQAELWMHVNEADPLEQGDERAAYGLEIFQSMCQAQYGIKPGAYRLHTDNKLEGGEVLEIGDMHWEVIYIPGHSPGGK